MLIHGLACPLRWGRDTADGTPAQERDKSRRRTSGNSCGWAGTAYRRGSAVNGSRYCARQSVLVQCRYRLKEIQWRIKVLYLHLPLRRHLTRKLVVRLACSHVSSLAVQDVSETCLLVTSLTYSSCVVRGRRFLECCQWVIRINSDVITFLA